MFNQLQQITMPQQVRQCSLACRSLCARLLMSVSIVRRSVLRIASVALLVIAFAASATHTNAAFADGKKLTRAEAVEIAKQRSRDGRVLSVKKKTNQNGVSVYDVKIISNGRVRIYAINEYSE